MPLSFRETKHPKVPPARDIGHTIRKGDQWTPCEVLPILGLQQHLTPQKIKLGSCLLSGVILCLKSRHKWNILLLQNANSTFLVPTVRNSLVTPLTEPDQQAADYRSAPAA